MLPYRNYDVIALKSCIQIFTVCSFHGNSMNNLLSNCGLVDASISASEKDLPVFVMMNEW